MVKKIGGEGKVLKKLSYIFMLVALLLPLGVFISFYYPNTYPIQVKLFLGIFSFVPVIAFFIVGRSLGCCEHGKKADSKAK